MRRALVFRPAARAGADRVSTPGLVDGAYVGVSLEAGRIGDKLSGTTTASSHRGASLHFALDTPIGSVYLAYGRSDGRTQSVYFFV